MQKVAEFFLRCLRNSLENAAVTKVSENFDQSLFGGSWREIFESAALNRNKSGEEAAFKLISFFLASHTFISNTTAAM